MGFQKFSNCENTSQNHSTYPTFYSHQTCLEYHYFSLMILFNSLFFTIIPSISLTVLEFWSLAITQLLCKRLSHYVWVVFFIIYLQITNIVPQRNGTKRKQSPFCNKVQQRKKKTIQCSSLKDCQLGNFLIFINFCMNS